MYSYLLVHKATFFPVLTQQSHSADFFPHKISVDFVIGDTDYLLFVLIYRKNKLNQRMRCNIQFFH